MSHGEGLCASRTPSWLVDRRSATWSSRSPPASSGLLPRRVSQQNPGRSLRRPTGPPNVAALAALAAKHGIEILGPPGPPPRGKCGTLV